MGLFTAGRLWAYNAPKIMSIRLLSLFMVLALSAAVAQRHKLATINAETDQGRLLQVVSQENDPAKQMIAMEEFALKFPKDPAAGWVFTRMQAAYSKAGNHDKAIETGEKLLAIDPMDIDAAYANLKASEGKKDAEGVLKWSDTTSQIARKAVAAPKTAEQSDEEFKHAVDFAKQVDTYTEYSLYATALQETDPAKVMKLAEALEQRNPKSQYIEMVMPRYSAVARQANAMPAAVAYGERAYQRGQFSEDMLLLMADQALQSGKEPAKVIQYAEKVLEIMGSKAKPEGVSDADWDRKKNVTTGLAYWMAGTTLSGQNKFAEADKMLRPSLPLVKDNPQLHGMALFHLGLANYKMAQKSKNKAQIADAVSFSKQSAAIKGPLQAQAAKNVRVMQQEFGVR
jgi:tetratricopeptide (TPR) repeat protein